MTFQMDKGTLTFADGRKYVGDFKNRFFNGQGSFIMYDVKHYVGEFKNDSPNGQGTIQEGIWKDGECISGDC